jgi:hypothetical protein
MVMRARPLSCRVRRMKHVALRSARALGTLTVLGVALLASPAEAHFILKTPAAWTTQDGLGMPQKAPPCGDPTVEATGSVTGTITALHPGETVTITIDEVIFHPGHYRIALASDRSLLPPEPPVTAASTPCGSVPVQNPPVFPVLADGVFEHTAAFSGPQTTQVTIPADVTCTKCTLQIIEFMSDHPLNNPGGCFYHHCADVSVEQGADPDGSAGEMPDATATGSSSGGGSSSGAVGGSSGGTVGGSSGSPGGGSGSSSGSSISGGSSSGGGAEADGSTEGLAPTATAKGCGVSRLARPAGGTAAAGGLAALVVAASVIRRRRRRNPIG